MYQLYHNKDRCELKLSKANKNWQSELETKLIPNVPYHYNDCYTFCTDRSVLREWGLKIKTLWLAEAQLQVEKIENIKI